jgi:protease-4
MGGVAASGGYWIATPAQEIWAEPTTITGSIGIFGFIPTLENSAAEIGVFEDGVALTETARGPSAFGGVPESWDRMIQANIEYGYERFLSIVAESRGMTRDEVDAVAQGRVWTGEQALERGLVDQLGGYDEAIAAAAERAGLEEGDYTVEVFEKPLSEIEQLLKDLGLETETQALQRIVFGNGLLGDGMLSSLIRDAGAEIEQINVLNDPNHVYATCLSCEAVRRFD